MEGQRIISDTSDGKLDKFLSNQDKFLSDDDPQQGDLPGRRSPHLTISFNDVTKFDDWGLPDYQEESPDTPVFPSDSLLFLDDGAFDVAITGMDLSPRLLVNYDPQTPILQADRYVNGIDSDDGGSGLAARLDPRDFDTAMAAANAFEAKLHENERNSGLAVEPTPHDRDIVLSSDVTEFTSGHDSDTVKARQYVNKVGKRGILVESGVSANHYYDNKWYREIESKIHERYGKDIYSFTKNELNKAIAEQVKNEGGLFLMEEEQKRYFEIDMQAVLQLELPVRDYVDIGKWDILSERGGKGNHHSGNKRFRKLVKEIQPIYQDPKTSRKAKSKISRAIVEHVHKYGGHFLLKDLKGRYFIMADDEAVKKTSQALREGKRCKWTHVDMEKDDEPLYTRAKLIAT